MQISECLITGQNPSSSDVLSVYQGGDLTINPRVSLLDYKLFSFRAE
jgi:hypothetical protein